MSVKKLKIDEEKNYATIKRDYKQQTVKQCIEAFFLDNIGKIVTREQIIQVATDPRTKKEPENWHQRLSELRTDDGYTILSWRNRGWLRVQEYLMSSSDKREKTLKRVKPDEKTWHEILERADHKCEWSEGNIISSL